MSASVVMSQEGRFTSGGLPSDLALVAAVNQLDETRAMGVALVANGLTRILRATPPGQCTVVYEYRPSPIAHPDLARPRGVQSSPVHEWGDLVMSCGGAVLAWLGVVGAASAAPVTGGQSLWGTAALWGGAVASTAACGVTIYRVRNMQSGNADINQNLDENKAYVWTMRGLDVVGLLGAGGAVKGVVEARGALKAAGSSWGRGMAGELSRQQRRVMTTEMALHGSKRVPALVIGAQLKQRLLAGLAAAYGIGGVGHVRRHP